MIYKSKKRKHKTFIYLTPLKQKLFELLGWGEHVPVDLPPNAFRAMIFKLEKAVGVVVLKPSYLDIKFH
jgi:hypothetical protein